MTNEVNKLSLTVIITLLIFIGCNDRQTVQRHTEQEDPLAGVFSHASNLIEQRAYTKAARLYQQFLERYPEHTYTDDAAYRLAYLHVTADPANPLLDYKKARFLFQNFIETYKNSRYINACKNWLAVLQPGIGKNTPVTQETADIVQLKQQISDLISENQKLRATLAELQQAIER